MRAGKRWRPFLVVAAYQALREAKRSAGAPPDDLKKIAVAVECFHKASLIHDDIEDNDAQRYGEKTLARGIRRGRGAERRRLADWRRLPAHRRHAKISAEQKAEMLLAASRRVSGELVPRAGRGTLLGAFATTTYQRCKCWTFSARKTAPAFEVALRLGAIYAGNDLNTRKWRTCSPNLQRGAGHRVSDSRRPERPRRRAARRTIIAGLRPEPVSSPWRTKKPRTRKR